MTGRFIGMLGVALLLPGQAFTVCQERAPNGQIYRELLPFVGLDGVGFELTGLGHFVGPDNQDFPKGAQEELERLILSDVTAAFRAAGVPPLVPQQEAVEVRPRLTVRVGWYQVGTGMFSVRSHINLMEAARLVKAPREIVWSSTWGNESYSQSARAGLATTVRQVVTNQVHEFLQLYSRAHKKTISPTGAADARRPN